MNIFTLTGTILVDSAKAEQSISKTGKEAEGLGAKLAGGIKTAAKWAAGVTAAATAVGGAMIAMAKDTAQAADAVDKGAQRMQISTDAYQELAHAADMSGVSMSTLEKAAKKLDGTDINFDEAIEQIYALEDAEDRARLAAELFGESVAYQMTPMLNASAEEMAGMRQEAHDLGLVMGEEAVKNGAAMNDMFTKVTGALKSLKNSLMSDFMPYIMDILQWVIDNLPQIQETVKSVMDAVWPIVKAVFDLIMAALPPLLDAIKKFLDWIMPYLKPIIESITGVVEGVIALINGDVGTFVESVENLLLTLVDSALGIGKDIFNKLWEGFKGVWEDIKTWVSDKVSWMADKLQFWKKSQNEMADGSHAAGLPYVPFDGYIAELHKGERVLNARQAAESLHSAAPQVQEVKSEGISDDQINKLAAVIAEAVKGTQKKKDPIELTVRLNGSVLAREMYDDLNNEQTYRGRSLVTV